MQSMQREQKEDENVEKIVRKQPNWETSSIDLWNNHTHSLIIILFIRIQSTKQYARCVQRSTLIA